MTSRERVDACLAGEITDRSPVTPIFMAWAANRVGRTYRDYYLDASAMVAAQRNVVHELGVDQVSTISDPWREADDYGTVLDYPAEGVGIALRHLFDDEVDLSKLVLDPRRGRCGDRVNGVRELAREFGETHSVLGWVEGPFAEYVDLRDMEPAMIDLYEDPAMLEETLRHLVANAILFAQVQIEAGASMIGIGDAAASLIGPDLYQRHVLPHEQTLIAGIHAAGATVKLHICGDTRKIFPLMVQTGADVIDLDYPVDLAVARQQAGPKVVLAGNFNPVSELCLCGPDVVRAAAARCQAAAGPGAFFLQPGCEVPPGTPMENLLAFCPGPSNALGGA